MKFVATFCFKTMQSHLFHIMMKESGIQLGETIMTIGKRIAQLRDKRGWTQEQLATSIGISRAALSHYEKNRREPDAETLTKLADLFHVSIDYLVGRTASPTGIVDEDVGQFLDELELSDAELLERFSLTIDGRKLTAEEARRFIAFVRAERAMG